MIVARSVSELHAAVSGPITFVPTMGALHDGHASLVRLAAAGGGAVVVSDFVNPTQFAPGEDFNAYPRDLEADAAIAEAAGADVLWAPAVDEVYPAGFATTVDPGALALELCGASRPGHFVGVATVVTRLFGLVQPTRAIFGRKDYQQFIVLQQVVRDLFAAYCAAPQEMQAGFALPSQATQAATWDAGPALQSSVADYIAGMTDRFAAREHHRLTGQRLLPASI